MSQTLLNEGTPAVELPQSLIQFYASTTAPGREVVLEAVDGLGDALGAPQWTFHAPRWVLDARNLTEGAVDVRATLSDAHPFPAQASLQVTVKAGRREYLLRFADGELAGRAVRDVLRLEGRATQLRMRRAVGMGSRHVSDGAADEPPRAVRVIVDGSASMRSPATRSRVVETMTALQDLLTGVRDSGSLKVSWKLAQDGEAKPMSADNAVAVWESEAASIGTAFGPSVLDPGQDHLLVTDDRPDGIEEWVVPEGARVHVVMVGSATPWLTQDLPERVTVIADPAPEGDGPDTAHLIADVATALSWNE